MQKGFVYFAGVMDWYSRRLLSWRLSTLSSLLPEAAQGTRPACRSVGV